LTSSLHHAVPGLNILFREENFELKVPGVENSARRERFLSFLAGSEEEPDLEQHSSDPALYWANSHRNKLKHRNKPIRGSYSKKGKKGSKLNYAFLKPQTYEPPDSENCKPASPISAFTFLNFVMAAGSVAANIVANLNDNNNNNNNNNNDNNDNSNNFNIQNNSNNANNANTIMIPVGKRRRRRRKRRITRNWVEKMEMIEMELRKVLETSLSSLNTENFCTRNPNSPSSMNLTISSVFYVEMKNKLC